VDKKLIFSSVLRCHFFHGWWVSVGVSLKKLLFGVSVFLKALCTANAATNAVPGTALMLGLASSLPPHTRSLEEDEGMGSGTTDTTSEYGGQVPSPASNV